jgi:hypothetical protein
MRRVSCGLTAAFILAGCQTAPGIVDTATLTGKMATQLNGMIADYVAATNTARQNDAHRLTTERQEAAVRAAANADQFKILGLAGAQETRALLTGLQTLDAGPGGAPGPTEAASQADFAKKLGQNTFDTGPLKEVTTATSAVAAPKSTEDEITVFGAFAKQVYDDLKMANTQTAASATPISVKAGGSTQAKP